MPAKATKNQQAKVHKVMSEYKEGTLHSGSGAKVTERDQAIAIGMSEAGLSKGKKKMRNPKERVIQKKKLWKMC